MSADRPHRQAAAEQVHAAAVAARGASKAAARPRAASQAQQLQQSIAESLREGLALQTQAMMTGFQSLAQMMAAAAAGREQKEEKQERAKWTQDLSLQLIDLYATSGINKDNIVNSRRKGNLYSQLTDEFNKAARTTFTAAQVKEKIRALQKLYRDVNASREQTGGEPDDRQDDELYVAMRNAKEGAGEMLEQQPLFDSLSRPPLRPININSAYAAGQSSSSAAAASGEDKDHPLSFDSDGENAAASPHADSAVLDAASVSSSSSNSRSNSKRKRKEVPQQQKRQRRSTEGEQIIALLQTNAVERARREQEKLRTFERLFAHGQPQSAQQQQQQFNSPLSPVLSSHRPLSPSIFSSPRSASPQHALHSAQPSLSSSSSSSSSTVQLSSRLSGLALSTEQRDDRAGADRQ
jgi:hypothetical protein